jgi:hypothetical protein
MKTTIEIHGYEIVIEENEGLINVSALKGGETVEEFELEAGEESEGEFDREEEEDFEGEESEEDDMEDMEDEEDFDDEPVEEEELADGKLESFNSFIKKRK